MRQYDFTELLAYFAGDGWALVEDIESDGGRDYYYIADDQAEAHVRVEAGRVRVTINDEVRFSGSLDEEPARLYVKRNA